MNLIFSEKLAFKLTNCKSLIKFFEDNKEKANPGKMGNSKLNNLEISCNFNESDYFGLRNCLLQQTEKFKKTYPLFDEALGPWSLEAGFQLCKFLPNDYYKRIHCEQDGSIQNIQEIPQNLKDLYKTAWEISQKAIIDQAADRGAYICQSQSLNIFMENANFGKLTSMHFYGWEKGLKTGMYYLRTKAATDAIKFTIDKNVVAEPTAKSIEEAQAEVACSLDDPDNCEMCSG